MRDFNATLRSFSKTRKHLNTWPDVDADMIQAADQTIIRIYQTHRDFQNKCFTLDTNSLIEIDDQLFRIDSITYDAKRPKYTNCSVTKIA